MSVFRLNAKLISENHKVWLIYSGARRRFFRSFADNGVVFLQTPGFAPFPGVFDDVNHVRRHLRMSDQIYRWLIGAREEPPSRNPNAYAADPGNSREPGYRRFIQEIGNIQRLFNEVQVGDLILSPPIGHYNELLIGEVASPWDARQVMEAPQLGDERVPYREVVWIRQNISRRDFPPRVARALQNPHAVSEFDAIYYEDVYKAVYRTFLWGPRSKIDFIADRYSSHDPLETYEGAFLIKYFIAAYGALERNEIQNFHALEPDDAIRQYYNPDLVIEFSQNFNSPGQFTLLGAALLAVFVGVSVAIATDPADLDVLLNNFDLNAGENPVPEEDVERVKDNIRDLIDGIGRERLNRIKQEFGEKAREKLNLKSEIDR